MAQVGDAVAVEVPPWSREKEARQVAGLVESVWTHSHAAIFSVAFSLTGLVSLIFLVATVWAGQTDAYPLWVLAGCGVAVAAWLYAVAPIFFPLPPVPPPHGPFSIRDAAAAEACKVKVRRVCLIANPVSGGGVAMKRIEQTVLPAFEAAAIRVDVHPTRYVWHAYEIARTVPLGKGDNAIDAFVVAGGDGTIHEVINGMMVRDDGVRLPIGVVPAGTGNSMLMDFMAGSNRLSRSPDEAVAAIIAGHAPTADLNKVTFGPHPIQQTLYSCNVVGFSSDQCSQSVNIDDWNDLLGSARYDVCALWGFLKGRKADVKMTVDGEVVSHTVSTLAITLTQHIGRKLRGNPTAMWDDGLLDICGLERESVAQTLRIFNGVKAGGSHVPITRVYRQGRRADLAFKEHEGLFNLDGQTARFQGGKISIEVVPKAIRFFASRSALCEPCS